MTKIIAKWRPLFIVYNGFLLVMSAHYLQQAYSGDLYVDDYGMVMAEHPESPIDKVLTDTFEVLALLDVCFLLFGPGIEVILRKATFNTWERTGWFGMGLLLSFFVHRALMVVVIQPF